MMLMPFTIDPVLPSFPVIGQDFGVPDGMVQLSLTAVTLGFALGQLLAGPLSDAFGRRKPMLCSIWLYLLGAFLSFLAPSIELFIGARFLMGIGASSAAVVALAIIRDLNSGLAMVKMLAQVYFIQGLAPIIGPILGSQLLQFIDWQQIFLVLVAFAGVVGYFTWRMLRETLHKDDRRRSGAAEMSGRFLAVLRDRVFIGLAIVAVLQTVALFCYLTLFSFILQDAYLLSPTEFGLWASVNAATSWIGVQVGARAAKVMPGAYLLLLLVGLAALLGFGISAVGQLGLGFFWLELQLALFTFLFGATLTPLQGMAMTPHGEEAGTAASLIGVLNFLVTGLVSSLFTLMSTESSQELGLVIAGCYAVGFLAIIVVVRPRNASNLLV